MARAGLESLLRGAGNIEIVGRDEHPDVILVDWDSKSDPDLPEGAPVVALADDVNVLGMLRSGVQAVLPHQATAAQIVSAVEAVAAGLIVLQPEDLDALNTNPRTERTTEPLTPRELEVLSMLAEGQSNKSIAHALGISEHTVKFHVTSIMAKLDAGSRTEAVTLGIRQGLIML